MIAEMRATIDTDSPDCAAVTWERVRGWADRLDAARSTQPEDLSGAEQPHGEQTGKDGRDGGQPGNAEPEPTPRCASSVAAQDDLPVPVESEQGKRWVLAIEGDWIVGIQYGGSTHWLTNPRMGGYAVVEVMPVAEHAAALAQLGEAGSDG